MTENKQLDFIKVSAGLLSALLAVIGWSFVGMYEVASEAHIKAVGNGERIAALEQRLVDNEKWLLRIVDELVRVRDIGNQVLQKKPNNQ